MKERGRGVAILVALMVLAGPLPQAFSQQNEESNRRSVLRSNIVGKVVNAQGNPIKNAKVTVQDPDNQELVARGTTNDDGNYVIECLDQRKYHLLLSALPERFVGQTAVVELGKEGLIVQWSASTEAPAIATTKTGGGVCGCGVEWLSEREKSNRRSVLRSNIVGKVVDAQGNPIKNAKVTVQEPDDQDVVARRRTDDKGNYVFECLEHDKYHLLLSALPERFVGQTAVVELGKEGLIVQWSASTEAPAIATARTGGGVCGCGAAWLSERSRIGALLAAGVVVVGVGVSVGVLVSDDDDPRKPQPPASPSQ